MISFWPVNWYRIVLTKYTLQIIIFTLSLSLAQREWESYGDPKLIGAIIWICQSQCKMLMKKLIISRINAAGQTAQKLFPIKLCNTKSLKLKQYRITIILKCPPTECPWVHMTVLNCMAMNLGACHAELYNFLYRKFAPPKRLFAQNALNTYPRLKEVTWKKVQG